jgi:aspartyl-tRNA(Asn)/glutamyl-tRNA(Gln) amidotransferase subunit A
MSGSSRPSPRLSGLALRTLATVVRTPPGALTARAMLRRDLGIDQLARLPESYRGVIPLDNTPVCGRPPRQLHDAELGPPGDDEAWPRGHLALHARYVDGRVTPSELVARALGHARSLAAQSPSMGALTTYDDAGAERDAAAATARFRAGAALGPLDGVPLVVKEQTAVAGFPLRLGTACLPSDPQGADATIVAALRRAGAVVLGQSPMTEYGLSPLGVNPHRRMPRNPHDTSRVAGGSSTGSGAAVSMGLVPLAVAADGGGSIRIPASLTGVFGIKPTWGRVSRAGDGFGGTFNHLGPIGATVADLAQFLEATSGADEADPATALAPPLGPGSLIRALGRGVRGVRIGVVEGEWEAAAPGVAQAGREALALLEREGATLVPLRFDFARYAPAVGYVLLGLEALSDMRMVLDEFRDELGLDVQVSMATVAALPISDYTDAWRLRSGLRAATAALLRDVDVLATPTTAITAPSITDDEARSGVLDAASLDGLCRFSFLANLTGLPAATCPVGVDEHGLPVGLQILGDAYDEATVLAVAAHLERKGAARVRRPRVSVDILEG